MTDHRSPDTRFATSRLEENEGPASNPTENRTMGEIIAARFSRRGFLKGSLAVSAIAATVSPLALVSADEARAAEGSAFSFDELEAGIDDKQHDLHVDDQVFVDFSAGYFLTKELQLKFEAQNLTDESYYVYTGRNAYNAQYEEYGPTYKLGLTFTHF